MIDPTSDFSEILRSWAVTRTLLIKHRVKAGGPWKRRGGAKAFGEKEEVYMSVPCVSE